MAITGRQLGKSSIQDMMMRELTQAFSDSIDKDIVSVCNQYRYSIHKSWKARNGTKMHRINVNREIYQWLEEEHTQAGASNPEWWQFREQINITDKLLTLLVMRWS